MIEVNGKRIKEFPISCREMGGSHIIYQGGGYFRLFPYHLIRRWARQDRDYLLSYIHPRKFKSYVGLAGAEKKLRHFLKDFNFTDLSTADNSFNWENARIIKL